MITLSMIPMAFVQLPLLYVLRMLVYMKKCRECLFEWKNLMLNEGDTAPHE